MESKLENLLKEVQRLEDAISEELRKSRKGFYYKITNGKVIFEKEVAIRHRLLRMSLSRFLFHSPFLTILTAPAIYLMILPAFFLDIMTRTYQAICFPVYGIAKVPRSRYVALDRHRLKYLNFVERLNCNYCAYFNGVIAFVREVAARTEQYWCPIRHALKVKGTHGRYARFIPYGDEEQYHRRLDELRAQLKRETAQDSGEK